MTPEAKKRYFKGGRGIATMRQGNGSELLGMNDPRSQNIGIIYVSPNDDRKGVLAAILTHEKLGRKQVAVVLPTQQNKAFQRPVDFEDLKSMRRRLKAQIIFIAPLGQGPAEYARQRRFTVYSSLESYKQALQEEKELPGGQKKGLFGRARTANGGGALSANNAPSAQGRQAQEEEKEEDKSPSSVAPFVMGGLAGAAAASAMDDLPAKTPASQANTMGNTGVFSLSDDDFDDEGDLLAPSSSAPAASQTATSKPTSRPLQPPAESKPSIDDDGGAGPQPIELPVRRARTTVQLDPKTLEPAPAPARASKARSSGTLAAGAAGAVGVAGLAAAASQRASSGANPPPSRPTPGGSRPTGPRRRRGRGWLIALLLLLLTLLIVGGVMAYFPGTRSMLARALPTGQPAATVSITPANQVVSDSYVITGVASNPDAARLQITARTLTQTAQQQKTVTASGHNLTQGIAATGKLTFTNGSSAPFTVAAGTTFKKANGVVIVTNTSLVIPAAVPGVSFGTAAVSAHATTVGAAGNLPAQAISGTCCTSQNFITVVNNTPFTGGQDPKDYRFVQQGDVDAAANPLKQPLVQQAWGGVQKQMANGEQLMNGAQCTTSASTDQPVGDKGINVPQATVTVAVKCSGTVYNRQQMLDLVKGQLQKKVDANQGTGYALVGGMQTNMKPQTPKDGMVSFIVDARGVWAYQFTDAQKQALAKQIAGKSVKDATALLQGQKGISKVQFSGGDVLPADPAQIAIQVQSISGLSGSANPPAVTPTIVNSASGTGGATAVPGNGNIGTVVITSAFAPSRRVFGFIL
jgi:hypothetical protein